MTARYSLPVPDDDPADARGVLTARLWAAGATGTWDRGHAVIAWFPEVTDDVPPGGTWEEEPDRDWLADWRRGLDPVRIGPLTVTPSWRLDGVDHPDPIVIDPGMAFGTGHHATTRFCLQRLLEIGANGARVLDVGCGTGILAIAASRLGATRVVAIDADPDAVSATAANAESNGARIEVLHGDLAVLSGRGPFDRVLANLVTDTVLDLAGSLVALTAPGGWLVTSGIGRDRSHEIVAALLDAGTEPPTVRADETWSEVSARRRR